jgi:hypothetical protein
LTTSPTFTKTSITSTESKSPISGNSTFFCAVLDLLFELSIVSELEGEAASFEVSSA